MVDKDGSFAYSNIVLLDGRSSQAFTTLYPNPTNAGEQALYSVTGAEKGRMDITITTSTGQVVASFNAKSVDGNYQISIPTRQLAGGYYIISAAINGKVMAPVKWSIAK
jgi:hypothetical protein